MTTTFTTALPQDSSKQLLPCCSPSCSAACSQTRCRENPRPSGPATSVLLPAPVRAQPLSPATAECPQGDHRLLTVLEADGRRLPPPGRLDPRAGSACSAQL